MATRIHLLQIGGSGDTNGSAFSGGKPMTNIKRLLVAGALFGALAFTAASAQTPSTLEAVKKRGHVICGGNVGLGGFSLPDSQGKGSGLDIDMCNDGAAG